MKHTLVTEAPDWWREVSHVPEAFRVQALRDAIEDLLNA
jgi:hypothetical protein